MSSLPPERFSEGDVLLRGVRRILQGRRNARLARQLEDLTADLDRLEKQLLRLVRVMEEVGILQRSNRTTEGPAAHLKIE